MDPYPIDAPKWNGGDYEVGLATFRVPATGRARIQIKYASKRDGHEIRPGIYEINASKLRTYPKQSVKNGVTLFVSPLRDWDHIPPRGVAEGE